MSDKAEQIEGVAVPLPPPSPDGAPALARGGAATPRIEDGDSRPARKARKGSAAPTAKPGRARGDRQPLERQFPERPPLERVIGPREAPPAPPADLDGDEERPIWPAIVKVLTFPFTLLGYLGLGGLVALVSLGWLAAALYYLDGVAGLANIPRMLPTELGMFVAGSTLPVLLLWFLLVYFRQARALNQQLRALRQATEQGQRQGDTLALTEQHIRLETYLKLSDFYLSQMAKETAILAQHTFRLSKQQEEELWGRYSTGDREVFFRLFFEKPDPDLADRVARAIATVDNASKSAHLFSGYYQVFLRHAESVDRGNLMLEAYRNGYLGDLSRVVNKALYGSENPFN